MSGNGVEIAFAEHDVVLATDFDFVPIVGAEQHLVVHLGCPYIRSEGDDIGPDQPLGNRRRRRNQDSAGRGALPVLLAHFDEQTVVEHFDGDLLVRSGHAAEGTVARLPPCSRFSARRSG